MQKVFLTLLLLFLPLQATGQVRHPLESFGEEKPFAQGFYEKAARHQADPQWVKQVLERAQSMRNQGLPTGPFFLKASEGLAKKVPASRIVPALDRTQKQTETAGRLVDQAAARGFLVNSPQAKRAAILNYQKALLNEVSPSDLQKISESIPSSSASKLKIEDLGEAAREIPKWKREGLSEDQILGKMDQKLKLKEASPKKTSEDLSSPPEKGSKGEKEASKEKVKGPKEKESKKFEKESKKSEKWEGKEIKHESQKQSPAKITPSTLSSPGKGHGKGK